MGNETTMFDFSAFPQLETERLILRKIVPADADAILAIRGDYAVTRLNIGEAYEDISEAHDLIDQMTERFVEHKEVRWGLVIKEDRTLVGMCGFNYWQHADRRISIGFDLARAYWNRGLMREALTALLHFSFTEMALNRVEADTSAENAPSIRLLSKLGFTQEGLQREQYYAEGAFHDLLLFGLLKREWEANASQVISGYAV